MVTGVIHYYKRLKFYDKIIFWSGCILFCYPQSQICLRWRKLIIPVYLIAVPIFGAAYAAPNKGTTISY